MEKVNSNPEKLLGLNIRLLSTLFHLQAVTSDLMGFAGDLQDL